MRTQIAGKLRKAQADEEMAVEQEEFEAAEALRVEIDQLKRQQMQMQSDLRHAEDELDYLVGHQLATRRQVDLQESDDPLCRGRRTTYALWRLYTSRHTINVGAINSHWMLERRR